MPSNMPVKKMIIWGSIAVVAIILLCVGSSMFATNGPDTNMVVQTPFTDVLLPGTPGAGTHAYASAAPIRPIQKTRPVLVLRTHGPGQSAG